MIGVQGCWGDDSHCEHALFHGAPFMNGITCMHPKREGQYCPETKKGKVSHRIHMAMQNTKSLPGNYWEKTLAQRAGANPGTAGSIYPGLSSQELEQELLRSDWESYVHPEIMPGCVGYRAEIPGLYGLVGLAYESADTKIVLDDRKGTGQVSATISGIRGSKVEFTVLILGQEQGKEVIFTFHPGDPVQPSRVKTEPGLHGKTITVAKALTMGLKTAKIV